MGIDRVSFWAVGAQNSEALRDPRHFQIAVLVCLIAYGAAGLDFEIRPAVALGAVVSALASQLVFSRLWRLPSFDPRSALISALSLCLLLRTTSLSTALIAGFLAVGSKFLLRFRGKHCFNPTAFALVGVLLLTDDAWVSAGQWGAAPLFGLAVAGFGSLVLWRARRSDVTWAFLGSYAVLLFGRAFWLGDPLAIPLHAMKSGAFLIFAFFMISDPRTTPDSRVGRIAFAALVAAGALFIRFELYHTNALLWSLVSCALLVPLIDRLLPDERFEWGSHSKKNHHGGKTDVEKSDLGALLPGLGAAG
jgi:Na+-transporting NADH:ubiquinone oxidoreductase subunit NqrB